MSESQQQQQPAQAQEQQQQQQQSVFDLKGLSASVDANYRTWLSQLQERFHKYMQLASSTPAVSSTTNNSNKRAKSPPSAAATTNTTGSPAKSPRRQLTVDDDALLQMTRREIEVLAAYHCELQRMISDQNQRIETANTELQETNDLAERLQVEVERKTGGGISPRRQAKQQMRTEIGKTRKQIDEAHQQLLQLQQELESVRSEHADVRAFISKQFFPVARVQPDQKWRDQSKGRSDSAQNQQNDDQQQQQRGFTHAGKQFVVKPTKAVELREALINERKRGFVPGTQIRSTTYNITQPSEERARKRNSRGASPETSAEEQQRQQHAMQQQAQAYRDSAQRLKNLAADGPLPHQLGQKQFVAKKIVHKPSGGPSGRVVAVTTTGQQLSQERHARARAEDRPPFRGTQLTTTTEVRGIIHHNDPVLHE